MKCQKCGCINNPPIQKLFCFICKKCKIILGYSIYAPKKEINVPKGILSFKLPEEAEEFKLAQSGAHYSYVIDNIWNYLRTKRKYEEKTEVNIEELEEFIRQEMDN